MKFNRFRKYICVILMVGMTMPIQAGWWDTATSAITSSFSSMTHAVMDRIRSAPGTAVAVAAFFSASVGVSVAATFYRVIGRRAAETADRSEAKVIDLLHEAENERVEAEERERQEREHRDAADEGEQRAIDENRRLRYQVSDMRRSFFGADKAQRALTSELQAAQEDVERRHTIELQKERDLLEATERKVRERERDLREATEATEALNQFANSEISRIVKKRRQEIEVEKDRMKKEVEKNKDLSRQVSAMRDSLLDADDAKSALMSELEAQEERERKRQEIAEEDKKDIEDSFTKINNAFQEMAAIRVKTKKEKEKQYAEILKLDLEDINDQESIDFIHDFTPHEGEPLGMITLYSIDSTEPALSLDKIQDFAWQLVLKHQKKVRLIRVILKNDSKNYDYDPEIAGEVLANHCQENSFLANHCTDELWFMAHSHGCKIASIAANRLHEQDKDVDRGVFMACSVNDEDVQPIISLNNGNKAHNFKNLLCFYAMDEVGSMIKKQHKSKRELTLSTAPGHTMRNIMLQYKDNKDKHLDDASIEDATMPVLARLINDIDTSDPSHVYLDAKIDKKDVIVVERERTSMSGGKLF